MAAGALVLVVLGGCGKPSSATRANDALAAGLKAQAAGNAGIATDQYNKVLSIDPKNKFAIYDLGLLDQLAGRTAQAEARYRAALAIDPNFVRALFNLAIIRTSVAPQEAEALYQQAVAVQPTYAAAYLNLGLLRKSQGKTQQGDADLAKAVSLDPSLAASAGIKGGTPATTTTPTTAKKSR